MLREQEEAEAHARAVNLRAELKLGLRELKAQVNELQERRDALVFMERMGKTLEPITSRVLLSEHEIIQGSHKWTGQRGVYFLIRGNRVVYVGQSVNVFGRIGCHASNLEFDSVAWLPCPADVIDKLESLYIHTLRPEKNGNGGPQGSKTAPLRISELLNFK